MINKDGLNQLLEDGLIKKIDIFESVDSTNLRAKEDVRVWLEESSGDAWGRDKLPGLYISDNQTSGRGRLGRTWDTPPGETIAMSYIFRPELGAEFISGVTLLASLAVTEAIVGLVNITRSGGAAHGTLPVSIKWPNDIVISGRKVCGILTELVSPDIVICGIGINANNTAFPEELMDKATSLFLETGKRWEMEPLAYEVVRNMSGLVSEYEKEKSLGFVKEKYNNLLIHMNKEIYLVDNGVSGSGDADSSDVNSCDTKGQKKYICRGIDETGALLAEDIAEDIAEDASKLKRIISGEISVRGVYGYV